MARVWNCSHCNLTVTTDSKPSISSCPVSTGFWGGHNWVSIGTRNATAAELAEDVATAQEGHTPGQVLLLLVITAVTVDIVLRWLMGNFVVFPKLLEVLLLVVSLPLRMGTELLGAASTALLATVIVSLLGAVVLRGALNASWIVTIGLAAVLGVGTFVGAATIIGGKVSVALATRAVPGRTG